MERIKAQVGYAAENGDMYTWFASFITDMAEKELKDLGYELNGRDFDIGIMGCRISWESPPSRGEWSVT